MKVVNTLMRLALSVAMAQSMFISLQSSENKCISQEKAIGDTIGIVYFISGEFEYQNIVSLRDKDSNVVWESKDKSNANYASSATIKGYYSLCVHNTSPKPITVTFEFSDKNKDQQILSVQSIDTLNSVVLEVRKKLDTIHFNIRNSAVRRNKHSEIARSINSKITMYTTIKIIFLIIFSLFQIMMVTSIFKNMKVQSYISISQKKSGASGGKKGETETSLFL